MNMDARSNLLHIFYLFVLYDAVAGRLSRLAPKPGEIFVFSWQQFWIKKTGRANQFRYFMLSL